MSLFDDSDSWLAGIGVDVQGIIGGVQQKATAVMEDVKSAGAAAFEQAGGAVSAAAAAVTGGAPAAKPAAPTGKSGAPNGKPSTVSTLRGSVGQGGTNNPEDVKAVQAALKIAVDGQCGGGTIGAIKAFQKSIGQANPDGRVDPGGATSKALAGGGVAAAPNAAPTPTPASNGEQDDGFLGGLKKKIVGAVEDTAGAAKDLGGKVIDGVTDLGGQVVDGAKGLGGKLDGAGTSGSATNSFPLPSFLKPDSIGGEVTIKEHTLAKQAIGKYFEIDAKVGCSIKFSGAPAGPDKPSKVEIEKGIVELVKSSFAEAIANAKFEKGSGIKFNPKDKQVGLGGAVALKTNLGPLTIEFATIEVSLVNIDPKKGLTGPKLSAGTSRSVGGKHTVRKVELELAGAVSLSAELTPNYAGIAADAAKNLLEGGAEEIILISIDAAAVAGLPLAVAAIVGIQIFSAGEKGERDAAILEGAKDTQKAAFDYAFTMTGNEARSPGPRAKAAVAVANVQLAKIASGRKISLEELKKELSNDKNSGVDLNRIHAQARQQFYAAYFGEIRSVIKAWRKDHNVLAIFTTEEDDFNSVSKNVAVIFEK